MNDKTAKRCCKNNENNDTEIEALKSEHDKYRSKSLDYRGFLRDMTEKRDALKIELTGLKATDSKMPDPIPWRSPTAQRRKDAQAVSKALMEACHNATGRLLL